MMLLLLRVAKKSYTKGEGGLVCALLPCLAGYSQNLAQYLAPNNFPGVTLKGMTNPSTSLNANLL